MSDQDLEQTDDLQTQEEEVVVEQPSTPDFKKPLQKYNLDAKWKTDDPVELVDEMGKSYVNAQQALREREQELAESRRMLQYAYQQAQPQPPAQKPTRELTDEEKQAKQFVLEAAQPLIEEQLAPLRQQNQELSARLYVSTRMSNDPSFAEAYKSGELGTMMTNMRLPIHEQAIDYAYNTLMYQKMQGTIAATRQDAKAEGEQTERQRQKAQVETGGRAQRSPQPNLEDIKRDTADMTEAEFDAYIKKHGIKLSP